jgi:hypothetical protein
VCCNRVLGYEHLDNGQTQSRDILKAAISPPLESPAPSPNASYLKVGLIGPSGIAFLGDANKFVSYRKNKIER